MPGSSNLGLEEILEFQLFARNDPGKLVLRDRVITSVGPSVSCRGFQGSPLPRGQPAIQDPNEPTRLVNRGTSTLPPDKTTTVVSPGRRESSLR